jgi:hypothetical protein
MPRNLFKRCLDLPQCVQHFLFLSSEVITWEEKVGAVVIVFYVFKLAFSLFITSILQSKLQNDDFICSS